MWNRIYHGILRWVSTSSFIAAAGKNAQLRIETNRVVIIRRRHSRRAWCQECACEVDVVRPEEAAAFLAEQPAGDCFGNTGWHVSHAPGGALLICLDSVLKSL